MLGPCAVGSLRPEIGPGTLVVPDQVVDRTWGRAHTVYDAEGPVVHVAFADPYCPRGRRTVVAQADSADWPAVDGGTLVVINGPRFSSRAESQWHAAAGWSVVGMTGLPEASIARELALCYTSIALVTDHDAGVESGTEVTHAEVLEVFGRNVERLKALVRDVVGALPGGGRRLRLPARPRRADPAVRPAVTVASGRLSRPVRSTCAAAGRVSAGWLSAGLVAAAAAVGLHVLAPLAAAVGAASSSPPGTWPPASGSAPATSPSPAGRRARARRRSCADVGALVGRVAAGPIPQGRAVTDADLLGPGLLTGQAAGPARRARPGRARPAAAGLVRRGDRVDLISAVTGDAVVSEVVVLATPGPGSAAARAALAAWATRSNLGAGWTLAAHSLPAARSMPAAASYSWWPFRPVRPVGWRWPRPVVR